MGIIVEKQRIFLFLFVFRTENRFKILSGEKPLK